MKANRLPGLFAGTVAVTSLVSPVAHAQTLRTWTGSGAWNTASNWSGSDIPDTASEAAAFTGSGSSNVSFSSNYSIDSLQISGSVGYTMGQAGSGSLTLNNANGFVCSTTNVNLFTPLVLAVDNTFTQSSGTVFMNSVSGAHSLTKMGAGTISVTGDWTYTKGTIVNEGTLQVGSFSAGSLAGDVSVASGATLRFNRTNDYTYAGVISGIGNVVKGSAGNLTLTGASTFTGSLSVTAGSIVLQSGTQFQNNAVSITGANGINFNGLSTATFAGLTGTQALNLGTTILSVGGNNASTTYSGVLSGTGGITKNGTGTFTLSADNTATGQFTVNAGTLQVGSGSAGSIAANVAVASGATLAFNRSNASTYSGVISGAGNVTKSGAGALTISGNHTFTGGLTISGGSVVLQSSNQLQNNTVTVNATNGLNLNGLSAVTIGGLAGSSNLAIGATALTVGGNNASTSYTGILSGTGSFTKEGTGTTTLTRANTYTGSTFVNAGRLNLTNTSASTAFTVAFGATLDFGGFSLPTGATITANGNITGLAGNNLTVGNGATLTGSGTVTSNVMVSGGTIAPGNSPGALSLTGNFAMSSGTYAIDLSGTGAGQFDTIDVGGSATFSGGIFDITTLGGFTPTVGDFFNIVTTTGGISGVGTVTVPSGYTFTQNGNIGVLTFVGTVIIPEANTFALVLPALVLLGVVVRRKQIR